MNKNILIKFFILSIIVLFLGSNNSEAQNKKMKDILPTLQTVSKVVPTHPNSDVQTILYDQTAGGATGNSYTSQDFETAFDAYDNQGADNITVPAGGWIINQVVVAGAYYNGAGPAVGFNVYFYSDASGIPGAAFYTALAQPYVYDGVNLFTIALSSAAVLPAGNYWVSIQCRMDYGIGGQWGWGQVTGTYGSVAQWQNPGGGFGTSCATWGPITGCIAAANTDMYFQLNNVTVVGPGPATNPSPANGATGVPFPSTTLSWTNPGTQTSVSVYSGTSPGTLALLSSGGSTFTSTPISGLSSFTQYFWRVDETNGSGTTTGTLWSFTTGCGVIPAPWTEDFESATFPPPCWTITPASPLLWKSSTGLAAGISGYGVGTASAWADFWGISAITPVDLISFDYNASGVTNPTLKFDWTYDDYFGTNDQLQISYSTNAGSTWVLLATGSGAYPTYGTFDLRTINNLIYSSYGSSLNPVQATDWNTMSLSLPTGTNKVKFTAVSAYGNNLFVDNIQIVQPVANDVGTTSIDMADNYSVGTIVPQATVKNFGTATNTFNVHMTIGGYSSTKTVTSLASGASQLVSFDNWNPSAGQYTVNVCTQLGTDGNASNDCKSKDIGVYTGSWSSGTNNPDPIYIGGGQGYTTTSPQDVTINYFFTMGGGDTLTYIAIDKCNRYDVSTNTWTSRAPMPGARDRLASAIYGNFIYVIGGYDATGVFQNTVFKYDIAGNSWSTVAPLPSAIGWGKAVGYNNRIYFAGGYDGTNVLSSVLVYDITANTWSPATSMPAARFGGAFSIVGNQLVYVGGADLTLINNNVYVGTIDGGNPLLITWTTAASKYPGLEKPIQLDNYYNITDRFTKIERGNKNLSPNLSTYPPGAMFRFEGSSWGTDAMIVAGGSPSTAWVPANPNPCYTYKPGSDTWNKSWDVPNPTTGAASGSVHDGNIWKLVISGGINGTGAMEFATQIWSDNIGASTTFSLSINVSNGWNLLSVPGNNPAGMGVSNWWSNVTGTVYKFVPGSGYASITTTIPGEGYWMKNTGASTYNYPALQVVPHNPINATAGWNMIGGFEDVVPVGSLIVSAGTIQFPIYQFNPGAGYASATNLNPGIGYWIKVTQNCTITMPDLLAKGSNSELADEYIKQDWGRIIITDAEGNSYTLYSVTGEVNLNNYELPPLPPTGIFDVRYGSGRVAEDVSSLMQTIEMRGAEYPVTVKVVGMNVKLTDESGKVLNVNLNSGESVVVSDSRIEKLMVSGETIPTVYSLEQNYPNPFNPSTVIEFSLPEDVSNVKLSIYNALGEKVAELVNTGLTAGRYSYQWNAKNVATGMYIYELRTDKFVSVKKMLLLK